MYLCLFWSIVSDHHLSLWCVCMLMKVISKLVNCDLNLAVYNHYDGEKKQCIKIHSDTQTKNIKGISQALFTPVVFCLYSRPRMRKRKQRMTAEDAALVWACYTYAKPETWEQVEPAPIHETNKDPRRTKFCLGGCGWATKKSATVACKHLQTCKQLSTSPYIDTRTREKVTKLGQSGQSGHSCRNIVGIAKYTTSSCNKDVATEILKCISLKLLENPLHARGTSLWGCKHVSALEDS